MMLDDFGGPCFDTKNRHSEIPSEAAPRVAGLDPSSLVWCRPLLEAGWPMGAEHQVHPWGPWSTDWPIFMSDMADLAVQASLV